MPETGKLDEMMPAILREFKAGRSIRLYPQGDSMQPMLDGDKDSVLLSPCVKPLEKYDVLLYRRPDGSYVLHRLVRVRGDRYDCCGDHQMQVENGVREEWIIAKVVGFMRKGRPYASSHPGYHAYCRMIVLSRPLRALLYRIRAKLGRILRSMRR